MPGEFEPNDSRNVTGTASTPDGRWTGQGSQTPNAAGQMPGQQQQQGGSGQSANPEAKNAPGSTGGSLGGQQGGSFSGADQADQNRSGGSGGQQSQFGSDASQMGGENGQSPLVGQVREHMTVVGPDGETCGRVDSVDGDRIKLTRSDSSDSQHHYLDPSQIETIEGDQIRLAQSPDWINGESSRPM